MLIKVANFVVGMVQNYSEIPGELFGEGVNFLDCP